jgi:hypothetical protein
MHLQARPSAPFLVSTSRPIPGPDRGRGAFLFLGGLLSVLLAAACSAAGDGGESPSLQSDGGPADPSPGAPGAGTPGTPGAGAAGAGTPGGGGTATPCPTYVDDFLPSINAPVCSHCHGSDPGLPNWGVYSRASASCALIGSKVAAGTMPPRNSGLSLSAGQRSLVAAWVALGCPNTASDTPASCRPAPAPPTGPTQAPSPNPVPVSPSPTAPAPTPPTPPTGSQPAAERVTITRAEWDSGKASLRLEGNVSNGAATLEASFGGRREALTNSAGRFRAQYGSVNTYPPTVTVTSSGGASVTSPVKN